MSSLFEHGLIRTAAVERVVAPIASHLCHLVLLCDGAEDPEHFTQLEGAAQAVAKATENMAAEASRVIRDTEDEVLHMEMSSLFESVTVSGQHVLLAAQKLNIQPSLTEHREELINATQNVFLGVVKVLLVDDDANIRRVVAASDQVLEYLSDLGSSIDIKSLLKSFQVFSEALLLLHSLTMERANALQDPRQTEQLLDSLETLRRCISMLHTAMCTTIKHPTSEEAQAAKRYILDKSLENVENSRVSLTRLRARIASLSLELADNSMQTVQKLHEVCQKWEEETSQLQDALSDVMDVREFTKVAIDEVLAVHSVRRHLDRSNDPIYRNGLLVLLKQVQSSRTKVAESVRDMLLVKDTCELNLDHMIKGSPVFEATERDSHIVHEEEHSDEETIEAELACKYDIDDLQMPAVSVEPKLIHKPLEFDLLPLLYEVVTVTKGKDVTELNRACTGVLELSNCYAQATKEAMAIVDAVDCKTLDSFRAEVVSLTPLLVQTAQETAMSSAMSMESLYKHSTQFTDLINNTRKVLLPVAGACKANKDYDTAIQKIVGIAHDFAQRFWENNTEEAEQTFDSAAETLLENVKPAIKRVDDCLHYVRDPRARSNLRSINDRLSFQISDIISRARLMVETHYICDTLSLDVQIQCWSAKAHYVVEEVRKQDGIHQEAKEQIMMGLQGKTYEDVREVLATVPSKDKEVEYRSDTTMTSWQKGHINSVNAAEPNMNMEAVAKFGPGNVGKYEGVWFGAYKETPSLTHTSLFLKQESDSWDPKDNRIVQVTRKMADTLCYMTQYLKKKGPIPNKEAFVTAAKDVISNSQSVTQFLRVIANHCLDKQCTVELSLVVEQILTITNQLNIISSVNAVTPGCKSSDEILVKNTQNLLQTVLRGVHAAESACITGLRQPEPNSDGAEATALCFQWMRKLEIHRAQQTSNPETDELGLRKTSSHPVAPSLASPVGYK
ncbi:Vinculin [Dissostichus eleginoides]|uniref:Vinculin n=1 Tax=Dissostichus eleginoides TaxID=100907 RepID=A0AAD9CN71_DISEL|nr:Vinculin [Dissostichus eleginoides]